jgi:AcrR family transcriptional regulator
MAASEPVRDVDPDPPTKKARATRAALIKSAGDCFVDDGYGAVTVRDLARRTQVTSGAIYGHFRNKADLLVAAIRERIASDLEEPLGGRHLGLVDYLTAQARSYRSRAAMRALIVEGAAASRVDADVRGRLRADQSAKLGDWRSIYRALQDGGQIDGDVDIETMVAYLWAAELGLGVMEALDVELPKPGRWAATVNRVARSFASERNQATPAS